MSEPPAEAWDDPFHPPSIPIEVHCIHCHQEYDSYLIEWREEACGDGCSRGFWCCPIPGCDGKGFGFDIFPVDPEYRDEKTGEPMWDYGGCGSPDEDCECIECRADRGELEPEEYEALMAEQERQAARDDGEKSLAEDEAVELECDLPGEPPKIDPDAEPMIAGGVDDEEFDTADSEYFVPLDDLLPENESIPEIIFTPMLRDEIERRLGLHGRPPESHESSDSPEGSGSRRKGRHDPRPDGWIDEDDIPY